MICRLLSAGASTAPDLPLDLSPGAVRGAWVRGGGRGAPVLSTPHQWRGWQLPSYLQLSAPRLSSQRRSGTDGAGDAFEVLAVVEHPRSFLPRVGWVPGDMGWGTGFADSASAVGHDVSSAGSVTLRRCGLFLPAGKSSATDRQPEGGKRGEEGADEINR